MNHHYYRLGLLLALWSLVQLASGQPLSISLRSPAANINTASTNANLTLTFSQPLSNNEATTGGGRVFSARRGGLLRNGQGGSASVSGSTFTFNPSTNFHPGETVFVTATTAIQSTSGARLSRGQVYQFTTRVGGTGRGYFTAPASNAEVSLGGGPNSIAIGDLDGDGDLDLLSANGYNDGRTVSVRVNNGAGSFTPHSNNPEVNVGVGTSASRPTSVVLGDVDGDGDLDFVTANKGNNTVSVRLNNGSGSFSPHPNNPEVSATNNPASVVLGDVDGDGDLDLLFVNQFGVSVRLNNGAGNFTPPATNPEVSIGGGPQSIVLGDLDGDRDLDLLTVNSSSVSVRLNNGSGNFTPPTTNAEVAGGAYLNSITLGDVDRDGDLDFVVGYTSNTKVSVRLNDGSGNFTPPAIDPDPGVGSVPYSVALGDMDGDGSLDIVTTNGNHTISVRFNNGLGRFSASITNPEVGTTDAAYSGVLGDVDGDGDLDILAAIQNFNSVSVRLNGPFPPTTFTGLSASPSPACAGQPVMFRASLGNLSSSYSYTLTNGSSTTSGTGTTSAFNQSLTASGSGVQNFTLTVVTAGQRTTTIIPVTVTQCIIPTGLNPSRNTRSASANSNVALTFNQPLSNNATTLGGVRIFGAQRGGLLRNGQGGSASVSGNTLTFNPATSFKPGETVFVTSTTAIHSTGGLPASRQVYQFTTGVGGTGRGYFTAPATNPNPGVGASPHSVTVGDLDGDGDLDFVTANFYTSSMSVQLNDGSGNYAPPAINPNVLGKRPASAALGDLDGDGDLDIVTANFGRSKEIFYYNVYVQLNDGAGRFAPPTVIGVGDEPASVALGDLDGDGDLDFVTANEDNATVSVRLNDGSGNFTPPATNSEPGVGGRPSTVALGDVDGDGDLDFVTANNSTDNVSVRLNDGLGYFTAPAVNSEVSVGNAPNTVALGDVDGDGDLDFVTDNQYGVNVRLNNGLGNFTPPATNPDPLLVEGSRPYSVALGDLDADGDLDFVTVNFNGSTVSVRLNDGSGNFTAPAINPNPGIGGGRSNSVALGDVDGDGDLDILAANETGANVSVRLNGPLPIALADLSASPSPICGGQSISFRASVSNFSGSYSYTLTNGSSTTSGTATSSAFTQPLTASGSGVQTFTLTVSSGGQVDTATTNVTVTQCVTLSGLVASPNPVCAEQPIAFRASVGNLSGSYSYTLTNGSNTISGTATSSTFTQPLTASGSGVQRFTLTVATPDQRATATTNVTVNRCLTLTELAPRPNERSPVQSSVNLTFNKVLTSDAATLGGVRVFSAQRGGLRRNGQGGTATVAGLTGGNSNRLSFNPTLDFKPGETVFVTSTTAIQAPGGNTATRQVYQFTTYVRGSGQGNFTPPATNPSPGVGDNPQSVAVGDLDGDGDLDLLTANVDNATVSVRLNNGLGSYSAPSVNPNPGVRSGPYLVVLGDVDGDGDLDFVTANYSSNTVSVRLNNGSGNFTPPAINPDPGVGSGPYSVALGDVDGDGDLDVVTGNFESDNVSIRLNDGSGNFTPPAINPDPGVGDSPSGVALGDVDGDGDLDLLTANYRGHKVSVRLNNGSGNFAPPAINPEPEVGNLPYSVVLGDVDGDFDLDFVTANSYSRTVSVRLNDGSGNFTPPAINPNPGVGDLPVNVALGDVDADGDLDVVATNGNNANVSVRLNDGSGNFTPPAINPNPGVGNAPFSVALGDVDGDGDLDVVTANGSDDNVSVRLNGPIPLTLTGVAASPNPVCAGQALSVTASVGNFSTSYSYTLSNGSTAITGTATTPTFSRSLTTSGSGVQNFTLTISSDGQVATATTSVTVNAAPTASLVSSGTLSCGVSSVTLTASGGGTYRFSNGATQVNGGNTATVTTAGLYSVTVTGSNGCSAMASTSVTTGQQAPSVSISASRTALTCASPTVSLTAVGTGSVRWSTGETSPSILVSAAGTYSVTLTSESSCTATARVTIQADLAPPTNAQLSSGTLSCSQTSLTLTATATGGVSYRFSGGTPVGTNQVVVTTAGVYSVTITGANGCTTVAQATVSGSVGEPLAFVQQPASASSVALGTSVATTVSVSGSGPLSYQWYKDNLATPVNGQTRATLSLPNVQLADAGSYSVVVTGSCGIGTPTSLTSTAFALQVTPNPLVVSLTADPASLLTSDVTSLSATVSGGTQPYNYRFQGPGVISPMGSTARVTDLPVGVRSFTVVVSDATSPVSLTSSATVSVTVSAANTAPTVASAVSSQTATVGQSYSLNLANTFSDQQTPNSLSLSASGLPAGLSLVGTTLSGTPLVSGVSTVVVTATDPGSLSASTSFVLTVNPAPVVNTAPTVVNAISSQTATVGQSYSISLASTFTDEQTPNSLSLSMSGLPAGLSLMGTILSGTPSLSGVSNITVTATDPGSLTVSTSFTITVSPAPVINTAPTLANAISSQTATVGQSYSISLASTFTDQQTPNSLSLLASGLPAGLSLEGVTLSGTPSVSGVSTVVVTATDPGSLSASTSFVLTVSPAPVVNTAPTVVNAISSQTATVGQSYSISLANTFTDQQTPNSLTLSASSLPAGLSLVGTTLSGTPSVSGVSTVVVTATDPGSLSASTSFVLTMNPASVVNTAPTVANAISSQTATVGQSYSINLANTFTDQQTPNSLSLSASGLPAGLSLLGTTLSGTPSLSGVSTVVVTATDPGSLTASTSFVLTVSLAPVINTAPTVANAIGSQTATVSQSYSLNLANTFTDQQTPNSLTLSASGLPAGLSLVGTTLSGTPSVSGVSTVVVTATDPGSLTVSTSFTITVSPAPATTTALRVLHRDVDNYADNNAVQPMLQLVNEGTGSLPLSAITLRYYLTVEGAMPLSVLSINYAQLGDQNVRLRYVPLNPARQGASGYVEYSFTAEAGSLAAGANSGSIQSYFAKDDYSALNELDDYSYATVRDHLLANPRITAYANGVLVWGQEPGTGPVPCPTISLTASNNGTLSCSQPSLLLTANGGQTYVFSSGTTPVSANQVSVSSEGLYSVTATSANGCVDVASVRVAAPATLPTPDFSTRNNPAIANGLTSVTVVQNSTPVHFSATNCSGTLRWQGNGLSGTGVLDVPTATLEVFVYEATCSVGSCVSSPTSVTVSVISAPANQPPVAVVNADQVATVGSTFAYTVNAFTDELSASLTYNASLLPANGLSFNPATRVLSGTPSSAGVVSITITATDPGNLSASTNFTITVSPAAPVTTTLRVLHRDVDNYADNNAVQPMLQLVNEGTGSLPLSAITLRYYLTVEGNSALSVLSINYAQLGDQNVRLRYVPLNPARQGASGYVEYSFTAEAGSLAAGANSGSIQSYFAKGDYSALNELDDYSYATVRDQLLANPRITAYDNGTLIWGQEPASGARQAVAEPVSLMTVTLLGNPVREDRVSFVVSGAGAAPLQLQLTTLQGRVLDQQQVASPQATGQYQLSLGGQSAGVFLLQVSSPTQRQTVKVMKAN